MRVLGIDPGVANTGYGVVDESRESLQRVASGSINTAAGQKLPARFEQIYGQVREIACCYKPQALALEKLYFFRNVSTAMQVGEARGVVLLAAAHSGLAVFEYTPLQVKQAVTGYGRAGKEQIRRAIHLQLQHQPAVDDEADALAVALCHLQHRRWQDAIRGAT